MNFFLFQEMSSLGDSPGDGSGSLRFLEHISSMERNNFTYAVICELVGRLKKKKKDQILTWKNIKEAISLIYDDPLDFISENSLRTSFFAIHHGMTNVRKGGKECEAYQVYLSQVYELPVSKGPRDIPIHSRPTGSATPNDSFQEDVENILFVENCDLTNEIKQLKVNISGLNSKVEKLEKENGKLTQQNNRKEREKIDRKRVAEDRTRQTERAQSWRLKYFKMKEQHHSKEIRLSKTLGSLQKANSKLQKLRRTHADCSKVPVL